VSGQAVGAASQGRRFVFARGKGDELFIVSDGKVRVSRGAQTLLTWARGARGRDGLIPERPRAIAP